MMAFTRWYAGDTRGALAVAGTAIARAAQVGHRRAEMIGHDAAFFCSHALMNFSAALPHAEASLALAQRQDRGAALSRRRFSDPVATASVASRGIMSR
jgi:hypothetical protein